MNKLYLLSLLALTTLPLAAHAQPDPNNAPKGDNPANRDARQNLTPEARFKRQLTQANVTSQKQQDAVIAYVMDEMKSRQKMMETAQTLQTSTRNRNVTDSQIAVLLNNYNAAVTEDKTRHEKALETLKADIDVTQFPRLEALLTLAGLYGDAPAISSNASMMALLGVGGRGGRRGFDGGEAGVNLGALRGNRIGRGGQNDPAPF